MEATTASGIDRIRHAFERARSARRCALLPFVTAGYPDLATTRRLLESLPAAGADLIEIGFPFSDPIADGPVIAESMHLALCKGVTPRAIFDTVASLAGDAVRAGQPLPPLVAMVSVSIVDRFGGERFCTEAVRAGFAGFIVPDADPADAERLAGQASALGAGYCALVAPTTPVERARKLASISTGFVYLLARAGVTGESKDAPEIASRVGVLRSLTAAPIAAGFGIATRAHVEAVGQSADGAIVGSALVRAMRDAVARGSDPVAAATELTTSLAGMHPR